ncbi:HNH endonuclease signature motif containing protein [Tessaracoccus palaemonis]|uniref:HNH endonuclease n=1 Tax=Tessaracoccus palaemonis TaxID=2829499 RepID=A0ABX8SG14_9ACTN|nr:HNH endonuclease signature motif containing protein [Tessaracoccus palaemonis]QXT61615.1 HNH endonuclease [Tessaracoccus palaemonis]
MGDEQLSTGAALAAIASALSSIDHSQRTGIEHRERLDLLRQVRRAKDRLAGLEACLISEAESSGSAEAVSGTQLSSLLGREEHLDRRVTQRAISEAGRMTSHQEVARRVVEGQLSPGHAIGIGEALGGLPGVLTDEQRASAREFLIEKARTATPREVADSHDEVLQAVAPELLPTAAQLDAQLRRRRERALQRRHLVYGPDPEHPGSWYFKGSLPVLEAEIVVGAITAQVNDQKRAERRQRHRDLTPTWQQRQADALVAVVAGKIPAVVRDDDSPVSVEAAHAQPESGVPGTGSSGEGLQPTFVPGGAAPRPASAPAGSALRPTPAPSGAATRPTLVVTVSYEDLLNASYAGGVLASGQRIPAGELRRIACDAEVIPVVLGGRSEILDLGRSERWVTPSLRQALAIRDGGCILPGCEASAVECEAHHIVPWWAGGSTSLENLALVCPFHHAKLEPTRTDGIESRDGWRIIIDPATRRPVVVEPDTG